MNRDLMRQNLITYWKQPWQIPESDLPAGMLSTLDQGMARITELVADYDLVDSDDDLMLAFLVGGLVALDMLSVDMEQWRKLLQAAPFAEIVAPSVVNVWMRCWAMKASSAGDVSPA